MKLLLLLVLLIGFAGYVLPARIEVAATTCAALDSRAGRLLDAEVAKLPQSGTAKPPTRPPGALGAALGDMVHRAVPFLPTEFACAVAYWVTIAQPDLAKLAPGAIPPKG